MNYDIVSFDLDGTLVDTAAEIAEAANRALESHGIERREVAEIDAAALLAIKSIDLIVRNVHVLARAGFVAEPTEVDAAARGVDLMKSSIGEDPNPAEP